MVNFILVSILIIVLFMVYRQMSCFDELIESIEYPTILIIYDDQYQIAKKYENDTINPTALRRPWMKEAVSQSTS